MVKPHCSNFRIITAILLGIWIFTVLLKGPLNPTFGPQHDKTSEMACQPSKDSDQPALPHGLIIDYGERSMGS